MFEGQQSIEIAANQDIVYAVATTYPEFVGFFDKRSRITCATKDDMNVEVYATLCFFIPTMWTGYGEKRPNFKIDFTQTKGFFQGLKAVWSFDKVRDGHTRASIKSIFTKRGMPQFVEGLLGRFVVEETTKKILAELKNQAEEKQNNGL